MAIKGDSFLVLRILRYIPGGRAVVRAFHRTKTEGLQRTVFGISFPTPVGVGGGIDRKGQYYNDLAAYGPSFVEVGPLRGVTATIGSLKKDQKQVVVFANLSNARKNVERSFSLIYDFVDAIVFNISSTSTISEVIEHIITLRRYNDEYRPVLFRLYPDLTHDQLVDIVDYALSSGIDGFIVPTENVAQMKEMSHELLPVVASGSFESPEAVSEALKAGASLVEVQNQPLEYGPNFIKRVHKFLYRQQ